MSNTYSYQVKCNSCGTGVRWANLPEPLNVDATLARLGWTVLGAGRHRCERCTERYARFDAAEIPDLDLSAFDWGGLSDKPRGAHW